MSNNNTKPKRTRQTAPRVRLSEFIRAHSPIKGGHPIDEDKPLSKYNKVMPHLYLGNYQAAKDKDLFDKKNIKAVLNCTKEIPNSFTHRKDIEYMRIPVDDSLKERDFELMYHYMPVIVEFIHKHVDIQGHNILVHCVAGRQRSCIAIAAYLVSKHGMTPHDACKMILDKRAEAFHYGLSLNFDQTLSKFYKNMCKPKSKK